LKGEGGVLYHHFLLYFKEVDNIKFKRGKPKPRKKIEDNSRVNESITAPEVRVIGPDGNQIGIVSRERALQIARDADLDLVEIAPQAKPPVCKVLDYSKYKYEIVRKAKRAIKNQKKVIVKEVKFRPSTDVHDYNTKVRHIRRFLRDECKVKATVFFKGVELAFQESGHDLLRRLKEDLKDEAVVESENGLEGRTISIIFSPIKKKKGATKNAKNQNTQRDEKKNQAN